MYWNSTDYSCKGSLKCKVQTIIVITAVYLLSVLTSLRYRDLRVGDGSALSKKVLQGGIRKWCLCRDRETVEQ